MRRLSSGWDQGLRLYSNNRNLLSSAVSQSHVNTVHTSYSQHRHRGKEKKKKKKTSHFKHSPASEEHEWSHSPPTPPSPKPNWYTIPSGWLFTLFTNDTEQLLFQNAKKIREEREREREKSLCFSLLLHSRMSVNKQKNEYIRSLRRLTSSFKILKYGSRLAMADGWSLDYKKTKDARVQNQDRNMIHSVVPPLGSRHSPSEGLLMNCL